MGDGWKAHLIDIVVLNNVSNVVEYFLYNILPIKLSIKLSINFEDELPFSIRLHPNLWFISFNWTQCCTFDVFQIQQYCCNLGVNPMCVVCRYIQNKHTATISQSVYEHI